MKRNRPSKVENDIETPKLFTPKTLKKKDDTASSETGSATSAPRLFKKNK